MEIKINRGDLLKAVSRVQSILEKKTNMPVLSTVLLHASGSTVHLSATDLEMGLRQVIPVEVIQEGSITVSGRKLFEICRESRGETFVIREKENNRVFVSDKVARFDLAGISADEFPAFVEPEAVPTVFLEGDALCEMINRTIYAVTLEEAGFKLSGVYTEKVEKDGAFLLRMVATDGHRLSLSERAVPGLEDMDLPQGVLIPKKGMSELNKIASEGGGLHIGFGEKKCIARKEDLLLVIRLLDTRFPDYRAVLPKAVESSISISRERLLEAMRKMLILSNDRYRAVKVTIENNRIQLVSTNPEIGEGEEIIDVDYTGQSIEAGFNPKYFIDVLQPMVSGSVQMEFADSSKPCMLRGAEDEGFLGLIMPMRVS